jgi:hypothetical protein
MPVYEFACSCGWEVQELFRRHYDAENSDVPEALKCTKCGGRAARKTVNMFAHEKVICESMERFENALLSPQQRAAGVRFTSSKDIDRYEEAKGMARVEPGTVEWDRVWDAQRDDARSIESRVESAKRSGGDARSAGGDYVAKSDIQAATGWSSLQYDVWKERSDAAERAAHDNPEHANG